MSGTSSNMSLKGLDGSNPLAFLASLGTLRALSKVYADADLKMKWEVNAGAWRPLLSSSRITLDENEVVEQLEAWLSQPSQLTLLDELGDNLNFSPTDFRKHAEKRLRQACDGDQDAVIALEFLASFGTDAVHQPHSKDRTQMQDTALRTMSGAGHQHFLKFMREIIVKTNATHYQSTLFSEWEYADEGRGLNLRWDPSDDRRYAMRWKNPSSDASMTMRGANRLAMEAMPLFATAVMKDTLQTTGFKTRRGTFWSWPIWEHPISLRVIQDLLQTPTLFSEADPKAAQAFKQRGIATVFRSQRITVGKFRSFTPAKAVSIEPG